MGMFSWLQQSSVPVAVWQDEHVGTLTWSDEEDGWIGSHAGLSFCISRIRESSSSPAPALLAYAKRFSRIRTGARDVSKRPKSLRSRNLGREPSRRSKRAPINLSASTVARQDPQSSLTWEMGRMTEPGASSSPETNARVLALTVDHGTALPDRRRRHPVKGGTSWE